jgi:hypothetical protein
MLRRIANNEVTEEARATLRGSTLIALAKPKKDPNDATEQVKVRPIAMGEVLLKLASSCVLKQLKSALSLFFMPLQAGVCTPGGAESIAHQVRQVLAEHSNSALATIDAANAFNSPSRSQIAKALKSNVIFAPLRRLFDLEYAAPSDLFFRDPNDVKHVLKSMMGVRQGSVLGPVFFCAAMHLMLCEISRSNKDLRVYAYMDDVLLVGAPDACGQAFQFAQRHLNEMSVAFSLSMKHALIASHFVVLILADIALRWRCANWNACPHASGAPTSETSSM